MPSRSIIQLAVCIAMMIAIRWMAPASSAQDLPATQSLTTRPADELPADSPLRLWFTRLNDSDPTIREQAAQDLMGISSDDLPKLRQLMIETRPIPPGQAAALREIVVQAHLAGEKYFTAAGTESDASGTESPYFLGLYWEHDIGADARLGVPVDERLPGFPGYRFLRKGDMVLGIFLHPTNPLPQQPDFYTPTSQMLSQAIHNDPQAQSIILELVRKGQVINVPIKMAPKPAFSNDETLDSIKTFSAERVAQAGEYWEENFAPVVDR